MKKQNQILGIDIGGTSIKAAIVEVDNGYINSEKMKIKTPNSRTINSMLDIFVDIRNNFNWEGPVGCGFPGVIKNGCIHTASNLSEKWIGINLNEQLGSIFKSNIAVINDADAAGIAEMKFGSGKKWDTHDDSTVLIITLGTGIGSALFVNSHLVYNTEFGHVIMDGVEAEDLAATVVREKENLSWREWGLRVNKFLNIMSDMLSPDCIIIGGGVSSSSSSFFKFINTPCELLSAKMGNDAGIIGAALAYKI